MANPERFFNVSFHFDLGDDAHGGYPFRSIEVENCFFMKRDGSFVTTTEELNNLNEDLIIVRRGPKGIRIPSLDNFDTYPELFDPLNPDADRHPGNNPRQDIGENEPYKITDVTRGEIEHFSSRYANMQGGRRKRRSCTKRKRHNKRRIHTKRRR